MNEPSLLFGGQRYLTRRPLEQNAKAFGFAQAVVLTHAATAPGLLVVAHAKLRGATGAWVAPLAVV